MRAQGATAKRYAKALFMAAREAGSVEAAVGELDRALEVFTAHPEALAILLRPWIKGSDRRGIAADIAKRAGCGTLVQDFVGLVADRGRMDHFEQIVRAYREIVDQSLGRVRAQARTAVALTEDETRQLARHIERALGKQVILEQAVDSSLLGGFVAQVGSLILDGSVDGQLARMRERLARG